MAYHHHGPPFGRIFWNIFQAFYANSSIPGSSKCVKFVPFHHKNPPKGRLFYYLEDLGMFNLVYNLFLGLTTHFYRGELIHLLSTSRTFPVPCSILLLKSWESKGTPPMPPKTPGKKALLRDYEAHLLVPELGRKIRPYFLGVNVA